MMWRLGSGSDFPNIYNTFSWPGNRYEQDSNISALQNLDKFSGGDKGIRSQKDWMDAVMSRLWELGGGQNWYSPTADRNVRLYGAPSPAVFTSTSDNFEWGIESGVPANGLYSVPHLHWQGLRIIFDNANVTGVYYNTIADQISDDPGAGGNAATSKTALSVGDCIYVDIDRTSNAAITPKKASLQSLGVPSVPGSRFIIAWRTSEAVYRRDSVLPINTSYPVATTGSPGSVRLAYAAGTPATPTVTPLNSVNGVSIGTGAYTITGNNDALTVVGGGNRYGIVVTGGASAGGIGIFASGGAGGASGGVFVGTVGQYGLQGTSDTGSGVYGSSGVSGFSPSGVYGAGNGATSRGVTGQGWQPQGASISADGGLAGYFFGGYGSATTLSIARAGGRGIEVYGGNGSQTNSGGAGADGVYSVAGFGGTAQSGSGSGGVGGRGGYFEGGAGGGTTSPFSPAAGGTGLVAVGGSGGTQNPSFLVSGAGGAGAIITGGVGGNLGAGTGAIITGGAGSTFGGASGGVGATITGGGHSSIVGTALVVVGVAPGSSGNGGLGILVTGGNAATSVGGNAITATGGNGGGGGNAGGFGIQATGGNGTTNGNGGHGVKGIGGNAAGGSYTGGYGGYFQGGTGSFANGYGLYSVGGAGNYGAYIEGGATNGSALNVVPGSGNGHAIIVNSSGGTGKAMAITSNMNIAYTAGRTMRKVFGGGALRPIVYADDQWDRLFWDGPYTVGNRIGIASPGVNTQVGYGLEFYLPLNAVITGVRVAVTHSGSAGNSGNLAMLKMSPSDTLNTPPYGWSASPILTSGGGGGGYGMSLNASAVNEILTFTVNGTVGNRTINSLDEKVVMEFNVTTNTSNYFYIIWVEVSWTMYDTISY